ncbi:DUF559 domain-containing protein [Candidatus Bathyarchaeota archaeon]|nr:DUF559 domain-containing protein [Candidatus Bathyarchaeota archaeon]
MKKRKMNTKTAVRLKAPKSTRAEMTLRRAMTKKGLRYFSQYMIRCVDGNDKAWTFTVDFLVHSNTIVEVKGETHKWSRQQEKDDWRENLLRKQGFNVVTVTDEEVNKNIDECLKKIMQVCPRSKEARI